MLSVRVTAAGAVAVICLSFMTAPASACDDRYIKKCERASAAAAASAEQQTAAPAAKRKTTRRIHVVTARAAKRPQIAKRTRGPEFAMRRDRGMMLASETSHAVALPHESVLSRRFRGFIDPLPMALNTFESLRRPKLDPNSLAPSAALPANDMVASAEGIAREPEPAAVALPAPARTPLATEPTAVVQASAAPAFLTQSDDQPSGFSFHKLVLAVCGALGAAGALRFIVSV